MTAEIDWIAIDGHTDAQIEKMINHAFEEIGLTVTLLGVTLASNAFPGNDTGFLARGYHPDGLSVTVDADFVEPGEIEVGIRCYSEEKDLWGESSYFEGCGWGDLFNLIQEEMETFKTSLSK